ncbi:hypothetical protein LTR10_015271 [Elasticomyces elasticus]|uniref:Uncharacterized protein n=1 Tax=Exophiala sideris TaxID=1016849 RepID=A0ABR0JF62_9EURO|nr:hypothetical protein LTR10_015271 [Elasticomyces elasticus]KAK5032746.1 hypothetical protein LTS07_004156 [Exophiala sideris]KAK5037074.1 hypothetical protein LTR13_004879 [Exophiala sideris]KAK5062270.1 hypothetical protein LTR69_004628 [Exophiala sideris]KAK5182232.1 hypothetical protein LTR44_005243 [Eurotiomycetes sp. CCFEE 6388]
MDISGFALVTGAGSGIGEACAISFLEVGAAGVALLDINGKALEVVKEKLISRSRNQQFQCLSFELDMRKEDEVADAVQTCARTFGRLDYVVNAAGIAFKHIGGAANAETSDWQRVLDVNLNGTFYCLRAAAQQMLQQPYLESVIDGRPLQRGSIVNIASLAGLVGVSQSTAYCASKHAVIGLTKTTALDYAKAGIRVNAVCPGMIKTPLIVPGSEIERVTTENVKTLTPIGRWGTPEEVANVIVFLCGGRSSLITGASLPVDGGYTAQ